MMNRRDTILIAVLINAGLLVILFATAMTGEAPPQQLVVEQPETPAPIVAEVPPPAPVIPEPPPVVAVTLPPTPPKIIPKETSKPQFVEVTVKRGDSLDKIARQNGTTIAVLMQANGLTDSRLQIGQTLRVPLQGDAPPPKPAAMESDYYVVESGDNPWLLASKLHIPLDDLLELNNLDEERARRLKPGDRIRVK